MEKRWELYFALLLLLIPLATAGGIMQLKFDFYHNGNVFLKGFKLTEGNPSQVFNEVGETYTLQVLDEKGSLAYQQEIKPIYSPGSNRASIFLDVPYEENYDTLVLKKGDRLYIRKPIHILLCNFDTECNIFETPSTCPEDCASEMLKKCKDAPDGICDSQCPADPDCQMHSPFNWIYLLLVLMVTGLVVFGFEEYKRIRTKHALLKQFNLPSEPGIGVAPAKVAPPTPVQPTQSASSSWQNKPS